jgi:hypothetical protein
MDARNDNYSEQLLHSYNQAAESREAFVALLDHWQIEAVVIRYDKEPFWVPTLKGVNQHSQGVFKNSLGRPVPLWRCVARDARTALFFRYDVCIEIPENQSFEPGNESLKGRVEKLDKILKAQSQKSNPGWKSLFLGSDAFPLELNLLVGRSMYFGEYEEAKSYAVKAMEGCAWFYPELWSNLACTFEMAGDTRRADFCWATISRKTRDPHWKDQEDVARKRRKDVQGNSAVSYPEPKP